MHVPLAGAFANAVFTMKIKECGVCPDKNCDEDSVRKFLLENELEIKVHVEHHSCLFMRWVSLSGKGKLCYYCNRVHELKYGALTRMPNFTMFTCNDV